MTIFLPVQNVRYIISTGDSKNNGTGGSNPPASGRGGWQPLFSSIVSRSQNTLYTEHSRLSTGGWKVSDVKNAVDAFIAALPAGMADPVLITHGAGINDNGLTDFSPEYLYTIDAFRTRFPRTPHKCNTVWGSGRVAGTLATINGWITGVIAARSSFCSLGIDEFTVLENGDNGVTYYTDGTHPTQAGYVRQAAALKTSCSL